MNPEIANLIATRLAAPKKFEVVTLFADGTSRSHKTEKRGQAENYAVGEKRKVGRSLINGETGATVVATDVYVASLL
ncbi:hypothetical protein [Agrobacterium tumefaciens]|uniref:hypothetical protein n=1 Tax=Agrobacterium tumefaciens TaxID=358 RepID=UPI002AFFD7BA|nr:hypothetical protein [Agrobacterium tumefaciens]MEA1840751.1 hypothetical protein [Agrobacterium tumefaciens]